MGARWLGWIGIGVMIAGIAVSPAVRRASAEEAPGGAVIGFVDLQRVFAESVKGRKAAEGLRDRYEAKQQELDEGSKKAQELQLEINKKSALWNEETKKQKEEEYRRMVRDLKRHAEDIKQELNEDMEKVWKELLGEIAIIIEQLGKERGYAMIFTWAPVPPSVIYGEGKEAESEQSNIIVINNPGLSPVLVYANKTIDITAEVVRRYDAMAGQAVGEQAPAKEEEATPAQEQVEAPAGEQAEPSTEGQVETPPKEQ